MQSTARWKGSLTLKTCLSSHRGHRVRSVQFPSSLFPSRSSLSFSPILTRRNSTFTNLSSSLSPPKHTRQASNFARPFSRSSTLALRLRHWAYSLSFALLLTLGYLYVTDTRAGIHQWLVVPFLRWIYPDAEEAHRAGTTWLKVLYALGLHPRERGDSEHKGDLQVKILGTTLLNPIGTSAGIDKGAEIPSPLLALGPAVVEVGAATPYPQEGNARPRVFRLPSQNALVNRYGFNSEGAEMLAMRLRERVRQFAYSIGLGLGEEGERRVLDGEAGVPPGSLNQGQLLAVQIAKNKSTPEHDIEAVKRDYVFCVDELAKYADILVVNVSSPNTPGLRNLQAMEPLTDLLKAVVERVKSVQRKTKPPAVMVKVSPDENTDTQIQGVCTAIWDAGVDGVIVGNTTTSRPDPLPQGYRLPAQEAKILREHGGYSGPQTFQRTLELVKKYRNTLDELSAAEPAASASSGNISASLPTSSVAGGRPDQTGSRKVIFASGGITNGKQALEVLHAGASVAMVYTALVYGGVGTISRIKREMREEKIKEIRPAESATRVGTASNISL